jgi:hypothetical protein
MAKKKKKKSATKINFTPKNNDWLKQKKREWKNDRTPSIPNFYYSPFYKIISGLVAGKKL